MSSTYAGVWLTQGVEILEFCNICFVQEKLVNSYGMQDARYGNSYNELTATFCVRIFKNITPMTMEVLEKMKKEYYLEKTICLSNGSSFPENQDLLICFGSSAK